MPSALSPDDGENRKSTVLKNRHSTEAEPPVEQWLGQRFSTLTALEAQVISVILSRCTIEDRTLLKMVADETHVSNAMLVKIAKKLGFDGFRSLRAALAKQHQLPLAKARQELIDHPTARALAEKARGASLKALEEAFSLIHFETLELGRSVVPGGPPARLLRARWLCPGG
jgi:DNA-binding MurR/RpiR family transcriptional regulator